MPLVKGHVRGGVEVRPHFRWAPGARRDVAVLAVLALAVVGHSGASGTGEGTGSEPLPEPTTTYPVHFEGWKAPKPEPRSTVSYPIRFER
ncbi:hypothetical protein DY218_30505 [Streptomyces triticagri]|uniref:Uncharacterized protein n=1 Tax=Streptomyces triticagri TaxID=2293568 RepID=A0A372LX91_9ACTN|nr:hypothetical protein DY218_30505 [Streptomyces triticagri]